MAVSDQASAGATPALSEHARRISYFMLVRLVILAGLTVLASVVTYTRGDDVLPGHVTLLWSVVGVGFALTVVFARQLPRAQDLGRFAAAQTGTDLLLSALAVFLSGGVDSGLATLYLISVLGAAIMGGPRLTWAAAATATAAYAGSAMLEASGHLVPMAIDAYIPLSPRALGFSALRTVGGIVGVTVLSSYLNRQLTSSVSALGTLRLLNENIVRSISSGLLTVDMGGHVLYFNPMARRILDLEDADIGRSLDSLLPGCILHAPVGVDARQELVVLTRENRHVRVGLSLAPLTDPADTRLGHVVNFQDLTRLHELSQQVRRNDSLAAVGGLAASVAHEIRNPLAAISGSAELLGTAELTGEDKKLLAIIRRESGRLSALITDLLSFTRPRPPQRRRTRVAQTALEAVEAFRTDPSSQGITLESTGDDGLQTDAYVDPAQLAQVLWNLLRNAGQALEGEGTILLETAAEPGIVRIDVTDNGPGIGPEHLERVFDPFFTTKDTGTGFGLAIVHRMVEENGGTIECESSTAGTRFTLRLPAYAPQDQPDDSGVLELSDSVRT
ncbi:MAG: PAS domain-containing protein [Nannocystaceae bacterium]|nr:PAS domain-containing protein [Nannocystaceae bacterium]